MAEPNVKDSVVHPTSEYNIYGKAGYITVAFKSPYNSMHQISGFKTEDDAKAWIAETKAMIGMYG
jgi:hypothetical protein